MKEQMRMFFPHFKHGKITKSIRQHIQHHENYVNTTQNADASYGHNA